MYVWLVAAIGIKLRTAEKGGKIFVHEDILKRRDDQTSGALKNVFVAPARVLLLHAVRQFVVPAKKENGERQQSRVLVCSRISENCSKDRNRSAWLTKRRERMSKATLTIQSLGAEGLHDVWHGIVEEWNPHRVLHRHLAAFISQQRAILKRSHGVEPGLRRAVNQTAIDPRRHLVNLRRNVGVSRQFVASASQFTCSRGAFGLCPVFVS